MMFCVNGTKNYLSPEEPMTLSVFVPGDVSLVHVNYKITIVAI